MSRIEELSDDFPTAMNLSSAPSPSQPPLEAAASASTPFPIPPKAPHEPTALPPIPPQMDSVRSHTTEEINKMMNRTPLFMTSLEDADDDTENIELEAMRALQYEGTRAEIAQGFRERGNEMAREKRWKDGKEFYTKGLAALKQPQQPPPSTHDSSEHPALDPEAEAKKEREIEEACYINRALCNLELQNYRSCTHDCASTLTLNPSNIKAYYRSTLALLALSHFPQARDALSHGLALSPTNTSLLSLRTRLENAEAAASANLTKRTAAEERAKREKFVLAAALKARGIVVRKTASPPDLEDAMIHLSPDPGSPTSHVVYPVLLLYPLHAQSDFIKSFAETDTLQAHLEYIFPLPWDEEGLYTVGGVECFMETAQGGMVKIGRKVSLGGCLGVGEDGKGKGKGEVVDGVVRVLVVPKGRVEEWVEGVKRRKGVVS